MILRQFLDTDPVVASYLLGCGGKAKGAVIDPVGNIGRYIEAAELLGLPIHYVVDTHLHSDHLSAGRELSDATGAKYVLYEASLTDFEFHGVADGDWLDLGNVQIQAMHTPGHTPEHISLLVTDRSRGDEPWFALTGHTLMVGDLGRTELAVNAEQGARDLFGSIQRLKALPDYVEILPGAFSGSVCGRSLSGKPTSTIGYERRYNKAFRIEDEAKFVAAMQADIPAPPPQADKIRKVNSGELAALV